MTVPTPVRRASVRKAPLSLADRLFSTGDDRRTARLIEDAIDGLEARLVVETRFSAGLVDAVARYLLDAGGKRVRPILAFLTAQLGQGITDEVVTAAASIELTHLASLYHDDVMDDADQRRGVPSAQYKWGNSVAILTGDLLFARASALLAQLGERAIRLQADTFERLCLGQLQETIGPGPDDDQVEHYLRVLSDKTGSLIAASAQLGVIFSGADSRYEQPVREFGEKVGIAFQLVDDVIDIAPSDDDSGKTPGTDIRAGVATLPVLYLRTEAETDAEAASLLARLTPEALAAAGEEGSNETIRLLREHAVTRRTNDEARRYAREAIAALDPLPSGTVKKTLVRFAETVVDRTN
ncbi:polyprenyl synthetase family protein [Herbiconiux moechotypicola]|uniref:Polyprenyl synthetase family protein n=1 Tax=Herbiconiux moechotypicola TaxID=637393 RepID=A0ABN3DLU9_9MICO|nr:polyprenyl synthetase family protein [Herbiconiux moechotypicola]MCS5730203.1 polyprenyl synthetase family protein [Herbiconiux moechotypicola]